jgi:hypothetical protein
MKAKLVGWLEETSGSYGDTVFKEKDGQTQITRKPGKRKTGLSDNQIAVQKRWAMANDYYKYVMLKPELLALYQQASEDTGKTVFMLCRLDWLKSPEITDLKLEEYHGKAGDTITIWTRDVVGVVKVIVTLYDDEDGTVFEQGQAVPDVEGAKFAGFWKYTATATVPSGRSVIVDIRAFDHPGKETRLAGEKIIK